jgi:hypothetical protein
MDSSNHDQKKKSVSINSDRQSIDYDSICDFIDTFVISTILVIIFTVGFRSMFSL